MADEIYRAKRRTSLTKPVLAVLLLAILGLLLTRNGRQLALVWADGGAGEVARGAERVERRMTDVRASKTETSGVRLVEVARGLEHPLFVTHAGDGSGRLFIVEQGGRIRLLRDGKLLSEPFLDLSRRLDSSGGERGLLGLAFAPDFATSRRFYVSYTTAIASGPAVRIASYLVPAGSPDRADPVSESVVLDMADPASNHNGGMIAFGSDGRLWAGTGDGGRGGDPWDNARNPSSYLGKMLRLDLAGSAATSVEIWGLGLRNPWRFSFDRATGELWIGDVGQNSWEEIDVVERGRPGPVNFGWRTMEGLHCYDPKSGCDAEGLHLPVYEYGHDEGCSVTGGYVYRGRALPDLTGKYLFSDYCTGEVQALARTAEGVTKRLLLRSGARVSSFGEDEAGELYLCDHGEGRVFRFAP